MSVVSSYSGDPQSTPKDAIRFLIGDTGPTFRLTDQEVVFALTTEANFWMAAAMLCDKMKILVGGAVTSKTVGSLTITYSAAEYVELGKGFRARGRGHQIPWSAEISQKFSFRQFDNWGIMGPPIRADVSRVETNEEFE